MTIGYAITLIHLLIAHVSRRLASFHIAFRLSIMLHTYICTRSRPKALIALTKASASCPFTQIRYRALNGECALVSTSVTPEGHGKKNICIADLTFRPQEQVTAYIGMLSALVGDGKNHRNFQMYVCHFEFRWNGPSFQNAVVVVVDFGQGYHES